MKRAFRQWEMWFQNENWEKIHQKQVCFQLTWDLWKIFEQIRKQSCPAKVLVLIFLRTHFRDHRSDKTLQRFFQTIDPTKIWSRSSRSLIWSFCWTDHRDDWLDQDAGRNFEITDLTKIFDDLWDQWSEHDLTKILSWSAMPLICERILDGWRRSLIWSESRTNLRYH